MFVDDQARFCAGSLAAGIRAAQIVRGELDGQRLAEGITVVRSLPEVEAMFGELALGPDITLLTSGTTSATVREIVRRRAGR